MSKGGLQLKDLKKWQRWLLNLKKDDVEEAKDRILRTAGLRYLEYADDLTPRRTGRLAGSLTAGSPENVFKVRNKRLRSDVLVGTAVPYAIHVNNGFSQAGRKGDFVPGEWKSGNFHYRPGHPGGMVLTGAEVPGAFMFNKAMDNLEDDMEDITEFELRRLYNKLFKRG